MTEQREVSLSLGTWILVFVVVINLVVGFHLVVKAVESLDDEPNDQNFMWATFQGNGQQIIVVEPDNNLVRIKNQQAANLSLSVTIVEADGNPYSWHELDLAPNWEETIPVPDRPYIVMVEVR